MKYRVRSAEGELEYQSFGQIEQAWLMGLVEPSDEILEEGHTTWRRADSYPLLKRARRDGDDVWTGSWFLWAVIGVFGATAALQMLQQKALEWKAAGLVVSVGLAIVLIQVTVRAQKRRRPHGK